MTAVDTSALFIMHASQLLMELLKLFLKGPVTEETRHVFVCSNIYP